MPFVGVMSRTRNRAQSEENAKIWTSNLKQYQIITKSRNIVSEGPLVFMNRMPSEQNVLERYRFLSTTTKSRKARVSALNFELLQLWEKFSFPLLSKSAVTKKLEILLKKYDKQLRKHRNLKSVFSSSLFDITNTHGEWLAREDRQFYHLQLMSNGLSGRCTTIPEDNKIHPSKRRMLEKRESQPRENRQLTVNYVVHSDAMEEESEEIDVDKRKRYFPADIGVTLMRKHCLSTNKSSKILNTLATENLNVPQPTQSGIWRASIRVSQKLQEVSEKSVLS